jgi:hypothetical protein
MYELFEEFVLGIFFKQWERDGHSISGVLRAGLCTSDIADTCTIHSIAGSLPEDFCFVAVFLHNSVFKYFYPHILQVQPNLLDTNPTTVTIDSSSLLTIS